MAEIIDLALVADSRRFLSKWLETRGLAWFLRKDAKRPFQLESERVDLVIRTAARSRTNRIGKPPERAFEHARREVRKELIRHVVAEMLQTGL